MLNCIAVGIGGFIGSVLRYLIGLIPVGSAGCFPVKTLCINILGSFVIALTAALSSKHSGLDPRLLLFIRVGLCGGFTTFSTFAYETSALIGQGKWVVSLCYMLSSAVLSVLAVFAAESLAA